MALDRLTKVDGGGISTTSDYRVGIITASKFVGSFDGTGGNFSGIITASGANFSGNVSIGGTLTYEDVTNIDSVGIITARDGVDCNGDLDVDGHTNLDNVSVAGVSTFSEDVKFVGATSGRDVQWDKSANYLRFNDNAFATFGNSDDLFIYHDGNHSQIRDVGTGHLILGGTHLYLTNGSGSEYFLQCIANNQVDLYFNNSIKLSTTNTGINVIGNTVADGLVIDGNSDLNGDLDVDGHTNLDNVSVAGVTTFASGNVRLASDSQRLQLGSAQDLWMYHTGTSGGGHGLIQNEYGYMYMLSDGWEYRHYGTNQTTLKINANNSVTLYYQNSGKLSTNSIGAQIDTTLRLYGAAGSGGGRLRLAEGAAYSEIRGVRNTDTSSELWFGTEIGDTVDYRAKINTGGHFIPGTDSTYDLGLTGTRWRNVYADTLYGDGSNLTGITQTTIVNYADNKLVTATGNGTTLNAESDLTFDGNKLTLAANSTAYDAFQIGNGLFIGNTTNNINAAIFHQGGGADLEIGSQNKITFTTGSTAGNATERLRIASNGHVAIGGYGDPGSILDVREDKDGGETMIRLFNTDNGDTTTQTAAFYMSPDSRGAAKTGLRAIKENASFANNAGRDISLSLNVTQNNSQVEALRIDSSGRIGVGVVPTAQYHHNLIQIGNQATLGANAALSTTGQTFLTHNLYYDPSGTYQVFNTSNANEGGIIQIREGYFAFSNSAATTGTPTVTERFRITSTGAVAISGNRSQTAPTAYNDLTGTNQAGLLIGSSGITDAGIMLRTGTTGTGRIYFGDNSGSDAGRKQGQINYYNNGDYMQFATAGSERLRITSGGTVNIGGDYTNTDGKLKVTGNVVVANGDIIFLHSNHKIQNGSSASTLNIQGGASNPGGKIELRGGTSDNDIRFLTSDGSGNSVEKVRITSSGDMGVGTNSPDRKLDVSGTGNVYGKFQSTNTTGAGIEVKDTAERWLIQADGGVGPGLAFYDLGRTSYRFIMGSAGQLGVGGANYGSSGQVLTSQGSSSAPQWATPTSTGNSPAFQAYRSSTYTATNGTEVVLDFDQETFDTDSCYNFNNGRFTPTTAGYYIFYLNYYWSGTTSNNIKQAHTYIRKNGSDNLGQFWIDPHDSYRENRLGMSVTCAASMNGSSDYVEAIGYCLINGGNPRFNAGGAVFGGFKLAT